MKVRVAKFIADSGIASRRAAEELISQGKVSVNGEIINTPVKFIEDGDKVIVDEKFVKPRTDTKLYLFHKPINIMTTSHDPRRRRTIYDILPQECKNLKYVGRLDFKTTGLMLLTNDGLLARRLTQPSSNIPRTYLAEVSGTNMSKLDRARSGVTVDGIKYRPMQIEIMPDKRLRITVTEGKKNEIRIVLKACGLPVVKLHRISYGPLNIKNLEVGHVRKVDQKTIDELVKTLL